MTTRDSPDVECPKSPNGLHDWYVLRATGAGAKDACRWCEKVKHLTDPALVTALTRDTPEAVYEIGRQPCVAFRARDELADRGIRGNVHSCCGPFDGRPQGMCEGTVSFCEACMSDHHSGGWDTCPAIVNPPLLDLPDEPTEFDRVSTYQAALAHGLSDAEAREEGWPTRDMIRPVGSFAGTVISPTVGIVATNSGESDIRPTRATAHRSSPANARPVTEAEFQRQVLDLARMFGWSSYHPKLSKWSERGWPDLAMVRGPRLIFAELKRENGKTSEHQDHWLGLLRAVPSIEVFLWRPSDFETIAGLLR